MNGRAGAQAPIAVQPNQEQAYPLRSLCWFLLTVATAPYRRAFKLYTSRPIKAIRATNGDRKLLIPLVKEWKADKYAELQSVQVAATFCGGAVFSSLPWSRSDNAFWVTEALWFCSLICSICAIVTSIQTKSLLDDLPDREQLDGSLPEIEVQRMRRTILRYKKTPGIKHWIMVFVWQFPSMTTAYAWCTYLIGLTVYLCSPFIRRLPWDDQHKVAIAYLAFGLVGLFTYVSATIFVYVSEKDFERSRANSRASTLTNTRTSTLTNRVLESHEAGTDVPVKGVGEQAASKGDMTSSTIVDEASPLQATRTKLLVGFEHSRTEPPRRGSGKTRRSLLY